MARKKKISSDKVKEGGVEPVKKRVEEEEEDATRMGHLDVKFYPS